MKLNQISQSKPTQPVAKTTKTSEPRLVKAMDMAAPNFFPPTKVAPKPTPQPVVVEDSDEEGIDVEANISVQDEREFSGKSATQVEDDVKELFEGTAVNHEVEIKEGSDIVGKFTDDFRLLPHQIQAREWMKERETGKSHGGILADDMGSVLPIVIFFRG